MGVGGWVGGSSVGPMIAIIKVRVGGWVSSFIALYVI